VLLVDRVEKLALSARRRLAWDRLGLTARTAATDLVALTDFLLRNSPMQIAVPPSVR
jgi:hypothetical protein